MRHVASSLDWTMLERVLHRWHVRMRSLLPALSGGKGAIPFQHVFSLISIVRTTFVN